MKFWITDGIIHHEVTKKRDMYARKYQVYADEGVSLEIPEDSEYVQIPDGVIAIGEKAFDTSFSENEKKWKNLKKIILPQTLRIIDDHAFEGCSALEDIVLPEKLEKLGSFALYATGIRVIRLPEGLKEIGDFCFSGSQLETITFPTTPVEIGGCAFYGCPNIKTFTIPNYMDHSMGFSGCTSLEKVENLKKWNDYRTSFSQCHSLKEMVIPNGAKGIRMSAFENCYSLQELTIPSSVKQVDGFAFKGCTGLKKLTLKSAFKGFEKAFPDSNEVSEVYITESAAGKAHLVFPKATIFSLRGKKLYSPAKASSKVGGAEAEKTTSNKKELTNLAVNGELVPNSGIKKFKNYAVDIDGLKYSFHVKFRGSQIANEICETCYFSATKGEVSEKLFDAVELLRANLALYTVEPHTGVRIPTLSEDYEMMGEKRSYSIPLESDEIIEYVTRFSTELSCCLTTKSIAKIIEYVPHKKNGMLAKSKITMVLKAGWSDSEGYTPVLIAKNVADNDLVLEVKTIYIGEEKYDESEAARVIGIVGSAPTRKDKAREKA
ncbi:MAG: leucine-rich repeat domain-containing protein [Clostridia bacterium]|nr:leucine-rich repeat domain-containing protein [Clostridia bacterium]